MILQFMSRKISVRDEYHFLVRIRIFKKKIFGHEYEYEYIRKCYLVPNTNTNIFETQILDEHEYLKKNIRINEYPKNVFKYPNT